METQADTQKTVIETAGMQLELAAQTGQLDALIQQAVRQAVMGVMAAQQAQPRVGPL